MCRYAMVIYKPHYACFSCRKTFKRRLMKDIDRDQEDYKEAKCPQCGELMANMGLDFKSPKKDNVKEREQMKRLYTVGITFHSCGCSGPGYIPESKSRLVEHFEEILRTYIGHMRFWLSYPEDQKSIKKENKKAFDRAVAIPFEKRTENKELSVKKARMDWSNKVKEVENKLALLKN